MADAETGLEFTFLVYPSRYDTDEEGRRIASPRWEDIDPFSVGFEPRGGDSQAVPAFVAPREAWLHAIAATLRPEQAGFVEDESGGGRWTDPLGVIQVPSDVWRFARYLFDQPIIPFRHSPLSGQSLADLVSKSGAGAGGFVGVFAGLEHGLLLLITAPGGMIIGGISMGIATALERGLNERVYGMIVSPRPEPTEGPQAVTVRKVREVDPPQDQ